MAKECGSPCTQPLVVADQDGAIYPVKDGRIVVPNYGPPATFEVKAGPGSPFVVKPEPGNPGCYVIHWEARFNDSNELISADGSTVLFTVPPPVVVAAGGIQQTATPNGTILTLKMDPVNPPTGFVVNSQGCLEQA